MPGSNVKNRIGKALFAVIIFSCSIGITSGPAVAEDWTVEVVTTDSSCVPMIEPASWSPDPIVAYDFGINTADINPEGPGYRTGVGFTVYLNLAEGSDVNCSSVVPVTGTIQSSWVSDPLNPEELVMSSMECLGIGQECLATDMYNDSWFGELSGSLVTPSTEGTFRGTLTVTWTPAE